MTPNFAELPIGSIVLLYGPDAAGPPTRAFMREEEGWRPTSMNGEAEAYCIGTAALGAIVGADVKLARPFGARPSGKPRKFKVIDGLEWLAIMTGGSFGSP